MRPFDASSRSAGAKSLGLFRPVAGSDPQPGGTGIRLRVRRAVRCRTVVPVRLGGCEKTVASGLCARRPVRWDPSVHGVNDDSDHRAAKQSWRAVGFFTTFRASVASSIYRSTTSQDFISRYWVTRSNSR